MFLVVFVAVAGEASIREGQEFEENGTGVSQVPGEERNLNNTYTSLLYAAPLTDHIINIIK